MRPEDIRSLFLEFFRKKDHRIVSSIPVVPHGDPTLLFTNAGMNQFKDVFLGTGRRSYRRAADTQKCIRVSGKHNDLEVVGRDGYHHTFFEMLGNWSFGDYFKKEAIAWGWEFMVRDCGLPPDRLYATVFGGKKEMNLEPDVEADELWKSETDINRDHVLKFGREDNFWEMGNIGPCGPCSEIHVDLGPCACDNPAHAGDGSDCRVNGDCGRYLEVWNLVFIQFNRLEDGSLEQLPEKHVDTGMGFERLCEVMRIREQLVGNEEFNFSNYNTELFTPIFDVLHEVTGLPYSSGMEEKKLVAYRVIADHIRALCIAIADGVMPDKKKRGSVLRSLLRRSARFGRQTLGIEEPFIYRLVEPVAEIFSGIFPEVEQRKKHIALVVEAEEKSFTRTIERGIGRFNSLIKETKAKSIKVSVLDGFEAFRLYHQDGFPKDLIEQMAREKGFTIHEEEWKRAEEEHRRASESDAMTFQFDLDEIKGIPATAFLGYWETGLAEKDGLAAGAKILKIVGNEVLVLDRTPFYAESGGQVGDSGIVEGEKFRFVVHDTGKTGDIYIHYGELEEADLERLPESVAAHVDGERRWAAAANHTATHLLHWALRSVLGGHAAQQGSLVCPDYLRFDFTHPGQVAPEQLREIERMVNRRIFENHRVEIAVMSFDEAVEDGAIALFGEKYGERVRMIKIGGFSKELCGGTHLMWTGQAGYFKILSESSVQSGVRRIAAVTRSHSVEESLKERIILQGVAKKMSSPPAGIEGKIDGLMNQIKELRKKAAAAGKVGGESDRIIREILDSAEEISGVKLIAYEKMLDMDRSRLGETADTLRQGYQPSAGVIAGMKEGNVCVTVFATKKLSADRKINCGRILRAAAEKVGRKGGGRPDFAQTGWREADNIDYQEFLRVAKEEFSGALKT